jgi:hypothetical protein
VEHALRARPVAVVGNSDSRAKSAAIGELESPEGALPHSTIQLYERTLRFDGVCSCYVGNTQLIITLPTVAQDRWGFQF